MLERLTGCPKELGGEQRRKSPRHELRVFVGAVDRRIVVDAGSVRSSFVRNSGLLLRTLSGLRAINALDSTPEMSAGTIEHCFYAARTNGTRVRRRRTSHARMVTGRGNGRTCSIFAKAIVAFDYFSSVLSLLIAALAWNRNEVV